MHDSTLQKISLAVAVSGILLLLLLGSFINLPESGLLDKDDDVVSLTGTITKVTDRNGLIFATVETKKYTEILITDGYVEKGEQVRLTGDIYKGRVTVRSIAPLS